MESMCASFFSAPEELPAKRGEKGRSCFPNGFLWQHLIQRPGIKLSFSLEKTFFSPPFLLIRCSSFLPFALKRKWLIPYLR